MNCMAKQCLRTIEIMKLKYDKTLIIQHEIQKTQEKQMEFMKQEIVQLKVVNLTLVLLGILFICECNLL